MVTPKKRVVYTHWNDSPKSCTSRGLMKRCPELAEENVSVPCSVYLLAVEPYRPSDSGWHLEPRRGWVIGTASMGNEVNPQRLVNLLNFFQFRKDRLPPEYEPPDYRPGLQVSRSPRLSQSTFDQGR